MQTQKETEWDFVWDYIEFIHQFGKNLHLYNIDQYY